MDKDTLAFIGGGYMARALIGGLIAHGRAPVSLRVSDPSATQRAALEAQFPGVSTFADNPVAATGADTWVFAVKPQHFRQAALGLAATAQATRPLVISVAAGVRASAIARWLGPGIPVVRAMPNRPALIRAGSTGLYAEPGIAPGLRDRATAVLASVGSCTWVAEEAQMDAVTAVSGSGPAYVFLLIEILEEAAIHEGLPHDAARQLAVETFYGAARMAHQVADEPARLREQVTSQGGTTEAALRVLYDAGLRDIFLRAVAAARRRAADLAAGTDD